VIAEPTRGPPGTSACQKDFAAGLMELLGDLAARLATPNHEHRATRQLRRVTVILDVDLEEVRWQRGRSCRSMGPLVGAGAQDHRLRLELAG
jgi:hypothetical protein